MLTTVQECLSAVYRHLSYAVSGSADYGKLNYAVALISILPRYLCLAGHHRPEGAHYRNKQRKKRLASLFLKLTGGF